MKVRRTLLKSKIHRATVTGTYLHYEGSITLDTELISAADLVPFERVTVLNLNNGARFDTYVIPGEGASGTVQLNGPAARLAQPGDTVIVLSYADVEADTEELRAWRPTVVHVDERNRVVRLSNGAELLECQAVSAD